MRLAMIERRFEELYQKIYQDISKLPKLERSVCYYQGPLQYTKLTERGEIDLGEIWGEPKETAFLRFEGDFGQRGYWFDIVLDSEACLFVDGKPYAGLDKNHRFIPIPHGFHQFEIEAYNHYDKPLTLKRAHLISFRTQLLELTLLALEAVYSSELLDPLIIKALEAILSEALSMFPPCLEEACLEETAAKALNFVLKNLKKYPYKRPGKLIFIPQSHIDLAWLWPEKETVRKLSRTFSTALRLAEMDSDFIFHQSQPQLFYYVKMYYPELYKQIKEAVKEGKFELVGGMWVEPDCNMPSGESLVRQLLYGKKFFLEEFGVRPKIEWLPDVFGFSPSLPQLLKDCGTKAFMTIKLNWNDTNALPDSAFNWRGIDGSTIPVFIPRALNEDVKAKGVVAALQNAQRSTAVPVVAHLIGFGDGGGGVTFEQLKKAKLIANLPQMPAVELGSIKKYVKNNILKRELKNTWDGELYLEFHRGTYTTQAQNKRWNRKLELMIRDTEILSSVASSIGKAYPKKLLEEAWKLILKNQMHDILPGSGIREVYQDSQRDYLKVEDTLTKIEDETLGFLASQIGTNADGKGYLIFNTMSFARKTLIKIIPATKDVHFVDDKGEPLLAQRLKDGSFLVEVNLPMLGYTTIYAHDGLNEQESPFTITANKIDNGLIQVLWGENGQIIEIKDLLRDEVLIQNRQHHLQFYADKPLDYDAWEIDPDYKDISWEPDKLTSMTIKENGDLCASIELKWEMHQSTIIQEIILYRNSTRVDFKTKVDWHERHVLLKTCFDTNIRSRYATYDIAFGKYQRPTFRNTSWQRSQFEVSGHKWADLSEATRGVSLLNDCKYGYDVFESKLALSLLRGSVYPDKEADQGQHEFTYAIYLHRDSSCLETIKQAYDLNLQPLVYKLPGAFGPFSTTKSFIELNSEGVLLDTLKLAEDGKDYILRFFETLGTTEKAQINSGAKIIEEVNLLEEAKERVAMFFSPYQVRSYRVKLEK